MPVSQNRPRGGGWQKSSSGWRDHATRRTESSGGDTGITKLKNRPPRLLPPPSPRSRAALPRPPATREPSPCSCTPLWLSASYWELGRTSREVAGVSFSFFFFFFLFQYQPWVRLPKKPLKGLLDGAQGFDEKQREGNTALDLWSEFGKAIPGPFWEAESRRPQKRAATFEFLKGPQVAVAVGDCRVLHSLHGHKYAGALHKDRASGEAPSLSTGRDKGRGLLETPHS